MRDPRIESQKIVSHHISLSEKGRRSQNQDHIYCSDHKQYGIYVVADGMGGHSMGSVASERVCLAVSEWWSKAVDPDIDIKKINAIDMVDTLSKECIGVLKRVNAELYDEYSSRDIIVGTTVEVLIRVLDRYATISAGDSRIYMLHDGKLECITHDDIWDELPETKASMNEEERAKDPRHGMLVSAIGPNEDADITIGTGYLQEGDAFLLCTDGIYKFCTDEDIEKCIREYCTGDEESLKKLENVVLKNAGKDNYSAISVRFQRDPLDMFH